MTGRVAVTRAAVRFGALAAVRALMIAVTVTTAALDPDVDRLGQDRLVLLSLLWLLVLLFAEASRRFDVGIGVVGRVAYLLDGAFIAAATIAATGATSPLLVLAFLHVIAVTLLGSYVTGLKVAAWDSLLLLMASAVSMTNGLTIAPGEDPAQIVRGLSQALALIAVAGVTAACSALNERELRRSRSELQLLLSAGSELERAETGPEAAEALLTAVTERLGFVAAAVAVLRGDEPALLARRTTGTQTERVRQDVEPRDLEVPSAPVLRAQLADVPTPVLQELLEGHSNVIVVPMVAGDVIGVLGAALDHERATQGVPARTVETLESLAGQAARTLQRLQLRAAIEELVSSDSLTGIANRRRFDTVFRRMLVETLADRQPLSLLLVDLDHFKLVNDEHGHQVGDEVLRQVASALRAGRRVDDLVARYGGEEFAVLLPGASAAEARRAANRLRHEIGEMRTKVAVTVSVGVATSPAHGRRPRALRRGRPRALRGQGRRPRLRARRQPHRGPPPRPGPPLGRRVGPAPAGRG